MSKKYELPKDEPQMVSEPVSGYAIPQQPTATYATRTFSPYQLKIINLMGHVKDDKEMGEISDLLSNYFAQKAIAEADKLWNEGVIGDASVAKWKKEHMRTSY